MFEDRFVPAADDLEDDYVLNREESRARHSHKHDKHKKKHKKEKSRDRSRSRGRSSKEQAEDGAKRPSRRRDSPELEDGEVLEDGEIVDGGGGEGPPDMQHPRNHGRGVLNERIASPNAVNGNHRLSEDGSGGKEAFQARQSSKPPSGRGRDESRERSAAAGASRQDHKSSRDRSRERSRERSRSQRELENDQQRQPDAFGHSSREGVGAPEDRSQPRGSDAGVSSRADKQRDSSRQREQKRDSSRQHEPAHASSRQPEQERSSSRQQERERERDNSRQRERQEQPERGSSRQPERVRERGSSMQRERDSSRQRERDSSRQRHWERERYDRDRLAERDRDRDVRYRSDRRYDSSAAGSRDERRRRSSRSRSREGRRGATYEERERQRSKRSREERDGDDSKRRRRHSESESEPELDLDPNALMEVDALGLSQAEKEEQERQQRLEESRRRRQEILAKHQQTAAVVEPTATAVAGSAAEQQPAPQAVGRAAAAVAVAPVVDQLQAGSGGAAADAIDGTATPEGDRSSSDDSHNAPGSPVMDIWNRGAAAGTAEGAEVSSRGPTAADDEQLTSQLPVHMVLPGTEPNMQSERLRVGAQATAVAGGKAESTAAAATGGDDMFAADDDMFAAEGDVDTAVAAPKRGPAVPAGLMDNYDDAEGYYNFQVGEVLDGRYEVFACKGKGVFSTVLRARDLHRQINSHTGAAIPGVGAGPLAPGAEHPEVAIKVIRSNETMAKAAALEQRILRLLAEKDPENRKHVIRLLSTFEFRHHVCMVFEPLDMNLRELTLKYGRNVGLNITAVAIYAGQLLVALRHLQQCRVLHADIKPDNILVNARRSKVKICDLGSAMLAGENERTPYLVSRFYRSPEVVLGLAYDFPMDMWSVGCVLYELFTGKILFPGRTNNEMLKLMMDVKGQFPKKMLKKGIFVEKHFEDDQQMSFALVEEDPVTKQPIRRVIPNPTIKHNFSQLFARAEGDRAQVAALADLLEKMLALDPEKRITPDTALRHPFVKPWLPKKKTAAGGH